MTRYYSPRIERDLITRLYHAARAERVPMTRLASRLLRDGLDARAPHSCVVRETPPVPAEGPPRPANR